MKVYGFIAILGSLLLLPAFQGVRAADGEEAIDSDTEIHIVREGETLWEITQRYYGNAYEWPQVWSYNPEITNPHWIYPGTQVRLRYSDIQEPSAEEAAPPDKTSYAEVGDAPIYLRDQGYLDADALKGSGHIAASRADHMLLMKSDEVYLRFKKKKTPPRPGTKLTVYRKIQKHERDKKEKGTLVRILGTVKVLNYDKRSKLAKAVIVESYEPLERGYSVAPMLRTIKNIHPKKNKKTINAKVIASIYPRKILAQHQLIFLDAGAKKGVEEGNKFVFLRKGDPWRDGIRGRKIQTGDLAPLPKKPKKYPDEIVGEGRVVDVQEKTSAVMITHTTRVISYGDRARMQAE